MTRQQPATETKRPPRPVVVARGVSFGFGWWYYARTEGAAALA